MEVCETACFAGIICLKRLVSVCAADVSQDSAYACFFFPFGRCRRYGTS